MDGTVSFPTLGATCSLVPFLGCFTGPDFKSCEIQTEFGLKKKKVLKPKLGSDSREPAELTRPRTAPPSPAPTDLNRGICRKGRAQAPSGALVMRVWFRLQKSRLMCFLQGLFPFPSCLRDGSPGVNRFSLRSTACSPPAPRTVYLFCLLCVLVSDFLYKLCICVASALLQVFA